MCIMNHVCLSTAVGLTMMHLLRLRLANTHPLTAALWQLELTMFIIVEGPTTK